VGIGCSTLVQVVKNNDRRHCQSLPSAGSKTVCGNANAIESNAAVQASVAMAMAMAKTFGFRQLEVMGVTPDQVRRA
jgi:hypothetical protein